jgi:hypothetical protein
MALDSDPDLLVLHGLRLKSFATEAALVELVGLRSDEVTPRLERFRDSGWVRYREGAITGWMLTPPGRIEARRLVADELDHAAGPDGRGAIEAQYRRFLALNQALLQCCTDWQLRPVDGVGAPEPNDHLDAGYDGKVVAALRAIDAEVQPICDQLAFRLSRFGRYGARFTTALERTAAGDGEWFTRPMIDSYHTVWFELHEDLLATSGIDRAAETTTGMIETTGTIEPDPTTRQDTQRSS